jgi:hypothetical protein
MKGLLIKPPWTDMILAGQKTWELRGSGTVHRGEVALIQSGSGTVVGLTTLVDVLGPLSHAELLRSVCRQAPRDGQRHQGGDALREDLRLGA